jgi:hypothetical protein
VGIWLTYKAVTDSSILLTETYANLLKKIIPQKWLSKILKDENPSADQ